MSVVIKNKALTSVVEYKLSKKLKNYQFPDKCLCKNFSLFWRVKLTLKRCPSVLDTPCISTSVKNLERRWDESAVFWFWHNLLQYMTAHIKDKIWRHYCHPKRWYSPTKTEVCHNKKFTAMRTSGFGLVQ